MLYVFCSDINERNRKQSILEAEEALKREADEKKQIRADPFTRRQCRPTMVTKVLMSCDSIKELYLFSF